jgi:signal transduction histidine kinase
MALASSFRTVYRPPAGPYGRDDANQGFKEHMSTQPGAWLILAAACAAALVIALLAAALVIQSRRRARAESRALRATEVLAHATRLATAGQLAAAITHEIRQPLAAILSNAAAAQLLLREQAPDLQALTETIADIRDADLRATEIVGRMREFLEKRELRFEPVDINLVVEDALALLRQEAEDRGMSLRFEAGADLAPVRGDPVHLQQVIVNLVLNAFDATQAAASGAPVTVRTLQEAGSVAVEVADDGTGLPASGAAGLFESFYTTKPEGMGLGLSIARMIVEAHHGRISAASVRGGGAVFRFTLPAATRGRGHAEDAPTEWHQRPMPVDRRAP